jgi:hypothetical protein
MTTTNQEKPFEPGETIDFCDDHYIVEANHGKSGTVREPGQTGVQISPFYWTFQGVDCRRVKGTAA